MDLVERAGELKPMLVDFALSPRFDRHLSAVIAREFPDGVVTDESVFAAVLDHFALQHRLPSGGTVVEAFVAAHPELADAERDMLLGWRDVVEGIFEVNGKDGDAVVLFNFVDELTYRTRSNLGRRAFTSLKKRVIIVGRLVRAGDDWMVSGNLATFPASARDQMLAVAVEQAMRHPEAVFRNPTKLAEARRILAEHHEAFVELFGADLIVVPGMQVAATAEKFHTHLAQQVDPDSEPPDLPALDFPDAILDSAGVAIHFSQGEGLSFYPDYDLLEELFANPALIARRRYRETLSGFLRDPDTSPEPLRRLAARDPGKTDTLFTKLLKRKGGFSWDTDGEALLRKHKPSYFDGSLLPRTVPMSEQLSNILRH
ncbi:MAG: hypothetical protein GEV11_10495 [Streptosporangiales bacterium]|nr:hypothetical protein [Streptosporangiales bacterium]